MFKVDLGRKNQINWTDHYLNMASLAKDERLKEFYDSGVVPPETPLEQVKFVALDFETTGLDPSSDDIISIGLVPFNLNRIFLRDAKHWVVSPNTPLEEQSVVIHGITHSDIVDAPDLKKILEELLVSLADSIVVVHFRRIEREFFNKALKDRIGEGILFPVVDTLELENDIYTGFASGFMHWLKGKSTPSLRLASCRKRYGLPAYSPHHALTDAIATAELLQAQISHHYSGKTAIKALWR